VGQLISGARMRIFCGWGGARWPDWWVLRGRKDGVRSAAADRQRGLSVQNAAQKSEHISLSLSLSLLFLLLGWHPTVSTR
jgi:hypothetical protein